MRKLNVEFAAECCQFLNLHESERRKPKKLDSYCLAADIRRGKKLKTPTQGYESVSARNMRLYHYCWRHTLGRWKEKTQHARKVVFAGNVCHQARSFLGGLLGDQQVVLHVLIICVIRVTCIIHVLYIILVKCVICIMCIIRVLCIIRFFVSAEGSNDSRVL